MAGHAKSRRALVAVSGGRDSVALLHGLHALGWKRLVVVHLDHRLRGRASVADAKFVARLAKSLGYACETGHAEVAAYARERGLSREHAARELRHVFFAGVARRTRVRTVFLAHHAEDQVETCLFNFLRGTGASGLAGMETETELSVGPTKLTLVRPLLGIRRAKITAFVNANRIPFREDASNFELDAARNRIRLRVLPAARKAIGESCTDAILRAAEILSAEEAWMQSEVARIPRSETLAMAALKSQPVALQRRLIRRWLADRIGVEIGFAEVERVRSLLEIVSGPAKINLPGGGHARRRSGVIFFEAT